jgi:hypothetical protein
MSRRGRPDPTPEPDYNNITFLQSSLSDPANVLRLKLKHLSELPETIQVRRVVVIVDVLDDEEGRGLDVTWSEQDNETYHDVQDSLLSLMERIKNIVLQGD